MTLLDRDGLLREVMHDHVPQSLREILAGSPDATELVLTNPFAFVVGLIADQSVRVETAWRLPYGLAQRLSIEPTVLSLCEVDEVHGALAERPALHRYPRATAERVVRAARRVEDAYGGDAAEVWSSARDAAEVAERLLAFDGIGAKKASLGVQLLARELGVRVAALEHIELAIDVHVRRVLWRYWGRQGAADDELRDLARSAMDGEPWRLTAPAWSIGRRYCRPRHPMCDECPLRSRCHSRSIER